MKQNFF